VDASAITDRERRPPRIRRRPRRASTPYALRLHAATQPAGREQDRQASPEVSAVAFPQRPRCRAGWSAAATSEHPWLEFRETTRHYLDTFPAGRSIPSRWATLRLMAMGMETGRPWPERLAVTAGGPWAARTGFPRDSAPARTQTGGRRRSRVLRPGATVHVRDGQRLRCGTRSHAVGETPSVQIAHLSSRALTTGAVRHASRRDRPPAAAASGSMRPVPLPPAAILHLLPPGCRKAAWRPCSATRATAVRDVHSRGARRPRSQQFRIQSWDAVRIAIHHTSRSRATIADIARARADPDAL
jgi:hypothetical protein